MSDLSPKWFPLLHKQLHRGHLASSLSFGYIFVLKHDDITSKTKMIINNKNNMKKVGKQFRVSNFSVQRILNKEAFSLLCRYSIGEAKWCNSQQGLSSWVSKRFNVVPIYEGIRWTTRWQKLNVTEGIYRGYKWYNGDNHPRSKNKEENVKSKN